MPPETAILKPSKKNTKLQEMVEGLTITLTED